MTARPRALSHRVLDLLLLVPALAVVLVEDVFWAGARALLAQLSALRVVRRAHARLSRLPPAAALVLFLVPEGLSHLAGLAAGVVLAHGHVLTATLLAVGLKGLLTLLLVWIYQACEPILLGVAWFARLHGLVFDIRQWALGLVAPLRERLRTALHRGSGQAWQVVGRFRALRWRVAAALEAARARPRARPRVRR